MYLEVVIKASKTDVFHKGVTVVLGTTGGSVCPVASILNYMANTRPAGPHPLVHSSFSAMGEH